MKTCENHTGRLSILLAFALCIGANVISAGVRADDCDGRYFSVDRHGQNAEVTFPVKQWIETLKKAKAGIAAERRNLATSYESGYLVSACHDKAVYWYQKAAESGDEYSRNWLKKNDIEIARRNGPECANDTCRNVAGAGNRMAVLYSDSSRGDHYFAPVTINGRTARGLIDTGATTVAMSAPLAKMFGIENIEGKTAVSSTANGTLSTTRIVVPLIEIAGIEMRNVPVSIGISDGILIGMSFLRRVNVSMAAGTLTMTSPR